MRCRPPADDATALSDAEALDLSGGSRIELRGGAGALVLNNARGTVELHEFVATGGHTVLLEGNRVVTGAAEGGGTLVVSFSDSTTAGDVAVLERRAAAPPDGLLRPAAERGGDQRAAGTDIGLGRRVPGPRLAREAGGPGTAPGAAEHPWRPVCPVRGGVVRRSAGLCRGRLRRADVQSAGFGRLRPGTRPVHQGADGNRGHAGRPGVPGRGRGEVRGSGRRQCRHHGRILRRLPDGVDHQPRPPLPGRHRGARFPGSRELHRFVRHRLVLRRRIHRPGRPSRWRPRVPWRGCSTYGRRRW